MKRASYIPQLSIVLLVVLSFILAVSLSARQSSASIQRKSNSITAQLLGDSRKLFANHFYIKADEYFHRGYYPSIFDQGASTNGTKKSSVSVEAIGGDAHDDGTDWIQEPRDWIDRFSRHFFPSTHRHLGDDDHGHSHDDHGHSHDDHGHSHDDHGHSHDDHGHSHDDHGHSHDDQDHDEEGSNKDVSEILPWLSIAAELNPNDPQIFVTGAYYLRSKLDQVDEAESFLREGWRNNPESPEIIFELARIKEEHREQPDIARNLYRLAIQYWNETESGKEEPDTFILMQLLMHFAKAEHRAGETETAIQALEHLKTISPNPYPIQERINELRSPTPLLPQPVDE